MESPATYAVAPVDASRRVLWALPRARVYDDDTGLWWNFDAASTDLATRSVTWVDAVDSITRWVAECNPIPVQRSHRDDGRQIARIVEIRPVTRAEMAAHDVDLKADEAILTVAEFVDREWLDSYDSGGMTFVSPGIEGGYTDDTGAVWTVRLQHLAATSNPVVATQQPPTAALAALRWSRTMEPEIEVSAPEVVADLPVTRAEFDALVARVAACEAMGAAPPAPAPVVAAMGPGPMQAPPQTALMARVISVERENAEIKASLKRDASRAVVAEWARTSHIPTEVLGDIVDMHMADPAKAQRFVASFGRGSVPSAKTSPSAAPGRVPVNSTQEADSLARARAKAEGIPYSKALSAVLGGN